MSIIEPGTLIVSLVGFVILYLIIKKVAFKPLATMMEERRVHIERQITEAEEGRTQAQQLLAEQRTLLEQARHEAKEIVDAARTRADVQARELLADAQVESQRQLDQARELIAQERAEALNGVLQQVSQLTIQLTTKLLHNHVSTAVHEEMLAEAEKRLGELVC